MAKNKKGSTEKLLNEEYMGYYLDGAAIKELGLADLIRIKSVIKKEIKYLEKHG